MKSILPALFLLLSHLGISQSNHASFNLFAKNDIQIKYPAAWKVDTSGIMGTLCMFFSPLENETDQFSENVNIIMQDFAGQQITLEAYKLMSEMQIPEMLTDGKILESAIIGSEKGSYLKMTYSMTQGKMRLKLTSVCFIKGGKAYLATFTAAIDTYDQYKAVMEEMLLSFQPGK